MSHKCGFQSGEVFDEEDKNSGQIDIIIYDNLFSTVFTDGSGNIVAPIEFTFGIISVKSKMGIKELEQAIEGIEKYNSLKRPSVNPNTLLITPDFGINVGQGLNLTGRYNYQQNINCIFAFDTTVATNTIIKRIQESGCVDLLVIPEKVFILGRHRKDFWLAKPDGSNLEFASINSQENSVSLFVLFLQIMLSRNKLISRNVESLILDIVRASTYTQL